MKVRSIATITALAATPLLAAPAAQAAPSTQTVSGGTVAASRAVAVPGLPMRVAVLKGWPTLSPKSLYNSRTKKYPATVRYLAKVQGISPSAYLTKNRAMNLQAYGRPRGRLIPNISVLDAGTTPVNVNQMKLVLKKSGITPTTTSTVKTRFGNAYRVHYRGNSKFGHFYGAIAILRVKDHTVFVDSASASMTRSLGYSSTALKGATWR